MYKIFLVEDDKALALATKKHLESWDYTVDCVSDFRNVISEFSEFKPHIVLLDIMLPFYNGYHWCKEIRKISNVPIIFISSADEKMSLIMAINMGGDDFISKPFYAEILLAKVQAILRRAYDLNGKINILEHKGVTLHLNDFKLIYHDAVLELTKNEFRIMETLLSNKGKIVSRDMLMEKLWQDDCYVEENTLTVNVARLRKLLGGAGLNDFIKTKVGRGYIVEL